MTDPRPLSAVREQVIREITVAPGWNKPDATALVDELLVAATPIVDAALLAEFDAFAAARQGKPASRGMLWALRLRDVLAALDGA